MHSRLAIPSLSLALVVGGCSSGLPADVSEENPGETSATIQGGKNDGNAHPSAIGLMVNFVSICSGALIAPNLILTARHCVATPPPQIDCATAKFPAEPVSGGSVYVTTNPNLLTTQPMDYIRGAKIFTPEPTGVCGNDIALVVLEENIDGVPLVAPNFDTTRFTEHTGGFGYTYTAIGYGLDAAVSSPNSSGIRRILDHISVSCVPGAANPLTDCDAIKGLQGVYAPEEFIGGSGTCQGDSGSSAYEQRAFNKNELVSLGVLSRGGASGDNCVGSFYTRTDSWKDLILEALAYAQPLGGYPTPAWAAGGSETAASAGVSTGATTGGGTTVTSSASTGGATTPVVVEEETSSCATSSTPHQGSPRGATVTALALALACVRRRRFRRG